MCPLRTPTTIATLVALFALMIAVDIAKRFVRDPQALKILRYVDMALFAAALLFVVSLFARRFFL